MTRALAWLIALALAGALLAGCGGSSSEGAVTTEAATGAVTLASPQQAKEEIDAGGVTVLDVRTPEEYASGHVQGAENVDFYAADFGDRIDALDHDAHYVVYCHSGNRSGQATALMAGKGFTRVTDVDGGIAAWEAAGLPTVTGS